MSHSVSITRTVHTTSETSTVVLNTGYIKTVPGLLKLAQLLLGAVVVGLLGWQFRRFYTSYGSGTPELFFLLMAVTFLIGTFCLLVSCLVSLSTGGLISKTIYELIYHAIAFLLYLVSTIIFLIEVSKGYFPRDTHHHYLAAGIIGCVISVLYLVSTVLAQRSYRGF